FGSDAVAVSVTYPPLFGVSRTYASFSQMAQEVDNARVWGGIHFRTADVDATVSGAASANRSWHVSRPRRRRGARPGAEGTERGRRPVPEGTDEGHPHARRRALRPDQPNDPDRDRTCDLAFRKRSLYPTELRGRDASCTTGVPASTPLSRSSSWGGRGLLG